MLGRRFSFGAVLVALSGELEMDVGHRTPEAADEIGWANSYF